MPKKKAPVKKSAAKAVKKTAPKKTAVKKRKIQKKKSPARRFMPWLGRNWWLLSLLAIIGALLFIQIHSAFIQSVVPAAREFTIGQGAGISSVARDLNLDKGQRLRFREFVRLRGDTVKAGTYDLPEGASVWRLARILSRGEIASVSIMIPEGLTAKQIANLLNANEFLTGEITRLYDDGKLFPDTYAVAKGTNRQAFLDLMARKMEQVKIENYDRRGSVLPPPLKDWDEVITLASIVQKETPGKEEMPTVASVYLNRLRAGMRLQADPTVVYTITDGLGDMRQKRLLLRHLQVGSPYNTYRNKGLPPAPIANPGLDAIRAVLNPGETDYLFFVADGEGGHNFSRTLEEHNKHRERWREFRRANNK